MKVLVACEFSGIVRDAFLARGHDAYSCDLLPSESPHPNHLQQDVIPLLTPDHHWDLLVAHPPCTYLSNAGFHHNLRHPSRERHTLAALEFFLQLWNAPIPRICVEQPPGIIAKRLGIPVHQTIYPHQFGHQEMKKICLRLRNLSPLRHTKYVSGPPTNRDSLGRDPTPATPDRWKIRSRFYAGIADAMADQWS